MISPGDLLTIGFRRRVCRNQSNDISQRRRQQAMMFPFCLHGMDNAPGMSHHIFSASRRRFRSIQEFAFFISRQRVSIFADIADINFYLMSFKIKLADIADIFRKLSRMLLKNLKKQS